MQYIKETNMKVYIYGLLDDGNITYVGKSATPTARLSTHINRGACPSRSLKILDIFEDKEQY